MVLQSRNGAGAGWPVHRPGTGSATAIATHSDIRLPQHSHHPRDWRENLYVYPVISRRSEGLSLGVNLNPDTACNFDCIYCQVDRSGRPRARRVDPQRLRQELEGMIHEARGGALFRDPAFAGVPDSLRRIRDIAFSGDGEPTTCPVFLECVQIAADLKRVAGLADVRIVLITDAAYLMKPTVREALEVMDAHGGEIWAKLDAGTEAYYQRVCRPNVTLDHVMVNIIDAARRRPVVIQSMFMRVDGEPPAGEEIEAWVQRLRDVREAGGAIRYVQVYTVARRPAESFVTALSDEDVDAITAQAREAGFEAKAYYGG